MGVRTAGLVHAPAHPPKAAVAASLFALYVIWGSTFLCIRFALEGFPPLLMAALRFSLGGLLLLAALRLRGTPWPSWPELRSAAPVGVLLCCSNGLVVIAEQWVSSGVTAVALASTPLWAALIAGLFGRWPHGRDWLGLSVGFCGVALLQLGSDMRASPAGAALLLFASATWAFGSILGQRLALPKGLMAAAAEMICGGAALLLVSLLRGEHFVSLPSPRALFSFGYLVVAGSIVAYSAYNYLLAKTRPAVATSYAYVNPIVAVGLGALLAGEKVAPAALGALALILAGVGIVMAPRR